MITLCSSLSKLTLLIRLCFTSRRLKNEFITTDGTDVGVHAGNAFTHSGNSSWQRVSQLKAQIWGKHRRRDIFLRNRAALGSCKSVLWALEWTKHAGKVGTTSSQDFQGKRRIQLRLPLAPATPSTCSGEGAGLGSDPAATKGAASTRRQNFTLCYTDAVAVKSICTHYLESLFRPLWFIVIWTVGSSAMP